MTPSRLFRTAVAASALVVAVAGSGTAAPGITLTSPADGATVSRSTSPTITMAGGVSFQTPTKTDRTLYLRNPDANCGGYALSEVNASDAGNGCSFILGMLSIVPGQENTFVESYGIDESVDLPLTIDASRPITGKIAISSITPNAVIFEARVSIDGQVIGSQTIDTGVYTGSYILEDSSPAYDVSIAIPAAFDKKDAQALTLEIVFKRYPINAISTWTELDSPASFISVPTYSSSFDRRVEVAVDGGAFSAEGVTLSEDLKGWTATIATPATGSHFLRARALQGSEISGTASNVLHVTA